MRRVCRSRTKPSSWRCVATVCCRWTTAFTPFGLGREDFERLAAQLAGIEGRFLLSLNDTPEVRETFAAFEIEPVETAYTTGRKKTARGKARELIVSGP